MTDPVFESDSILNTVKRSLDVAIDDTSFDTALILHINSVFSDLYQIGLGAYGDVEFEVTGANNTWTIAFGSQQNLGMIKSYVALRVRLLFDPPQAGFTTLSMQSQVDKMEWRIRTAASSSPNSFGAESIITPGPVAGRATIWDLTGLTTFPANAPVNAVGVDLVTGNIYRKDS